MLKKLPQSGLQRAEHARMVWTALPEDGTPYEDMLKPEYWSHVTNSASAPRPWDIIEVRPADASYLAILLVRDVGPQWVKVAELHKYDFGQRKTAAAPAFEHPDYDIEHRGAARWRVKRKSDNEIMASGLATRADAEQWLRGLVEKLAA